MKLYENRKVVLLSKHGKETVIEPLLTSQTGCEFLTDASFDTDRFGTFTRDIKRRKTQLETARLKIKKGLKRTWAEIGIASEGSFGAHPLIGVPWNVELVVLYDRRHKIEVHGVHESSETNYSHTSVNSYEALKDFAAGIGFPSHYLILRPGHANAKPILKDIDDFEKLKAAFEWCQSKADDGVVFVETDMRAFANPTRMKNIEKATENLLGKLMQFCPVCGAPGFIVSEVVQGLPCELCGMPSEMTHKLIHACQKCRHTEEQLHPRGAFAPARYCHYCNP